MRYALFAALLLACSSSTVRDQSPKEIPASKAVEQASACAPHPFTPKPAGSFKHSRSVLVTQIGNPRHSVQDPISIPQGPVLIEGKFSYGALSKDLEDESIRLSIDTCEGWKELGEASTDDDGRVSFSLNAPSSPGIYGIRLQVVGDGTLAEGWLAVYPPKTRLSVFDIDGTLTSSDMELIKDIGSDLFAPLGKGEYVPQAYPGASRITQVQSGQGYLNVYLTGRPYWLSGITRGWLSQIKAAPGILHLTDSNREAAMTRDGVGDYKLRFLKDLLARGFLIDFAFGNASTDIYAYLGAGIPKERVFIIGKHAGEQGTRGVKDTWESIADELFALPSAEQP